MPAKHYNEIRKLGELIRAHRSTIVFANNRRAVERITANLNEGPESGQWSVIGGQAPEEGDQ